MLNETSSATMVYMSSEDKDGDGDNDDSEMSVGAGARVRTVSPNLSSPLDDKS